MQSETESGRPLGPMITSFNHGKEMQVKVVWACIKISRSCQGKRQSYKEQCKEGEEEAVKNSVGRITCLSGQVEVL